MDAKLSKLQAIHLDQGEKLASHSNRIIKVANEFNGAGHSLSEIEMKRALLRGVSSAFVVTPSPIMDGM